MEEFIKRRDGEEFFQWKLRLIQGKAEGIIDIDWSEMVEILGLDCSGDHSRKTSYGIKECADYFRVQVTPETQLDAVKEKIGELDTLKQQVKNEKNSLNKIKREFIKSISIAEELEGYLREHGTIIIPEYCYDPVNEFSKHIMIIHITDWHIGYVINDCKGNYFNWAIANQRIDKLLQECIKYIEIYGIKKVYVVNTGDAIEHNSMRLNQSQFCEFTQAEQINKAIELIYGLLVALCKYCDVEYDSVYGNHDRMNGDRTANLDGDNAEVIIREQLRTYKELSNNNRLIVINRRHTDKEIRKVINGVNCKFIHGEDVKPDGRQQLKNEMSVDNEFYDLLFKGHNHHFKIESENNGRYVVSTGCLSGYNDYSVKFGCTSVASQTIVVLAEDKIELIKDIQLQ